MKIVNAVRMFGKVGRGAGRYWLLNSTGGVEGTYRTYARALAARRQMRKAWRP